MDGRSRGLELFASYSPLRRWNIALGYTLFDLNAINTHGTPSDYALQQLNMPRHQLQLRSFLNITPSVDLATALYYVGPWDCRITSSNLTHISGYTRVDANLTWHFARRLDFSVVGQNLSRPNHQEFAGLDTRGSQTTVPRSVYGKVTWRF
jgi:iron complex outermembrane receptor protein